MSGKKKQSSVNVETLDPDDIAPYIHKDDMDFLPEEMSELVPTQGPGSSSSIPPPMQRVERLDPNLEKLSKTWMCVYPLYIDANKTMSQGRRIPKEFAVNEPVAVYMAEVVRSLGLSCIFENGKRHPKDPFTFGRLRVQVRYGEGDGAALRGNPIQTNIRNKKDLLLAICKGLPVAEEALKASDPRIPTMAAASRSVISSTVEKMAQEAVKEIKEAQGLGKPKKKNKKK
ncbi:signal recognition particle subunit [Nowakowskiella sp. JEL0078]|nr:signal recognition particle subunit [Nowakowskiella sp. JEL0078]